MPSFLATSEHLPTLTHLGVDGFVHVASPIGDLSDATTASSIGIKGALNALEACAKAPLVKRFVFTSSSLAAAFPKPGVECSINKNSYNEEAVAIAHEQKDPATRGLCIYAAMKTETEKAIWKWMQDNKPGFVLNTIVSSGRNFSIDLLTLDVRSCPMQILAASSSQNIRVSLPLSSGLDRHGRASI